MWENSEVDHVIEFHLLREAFLQLYHIKESDLQVTSDGYLEPKYRDAWSDFHKDHAVLRIVSKSAHVIRHSPGYVEKGRVPSIMIKPSDVFWMIYLAISGRQDIKFSYGFGVTLTGGAKKLDIRRLRGRTFRLVFNAKLESGHWAQVRDVIITFDGISDLTFLKDSILDYFDPDKKQAITYNVGDVELQGLDNQIRSALRSFMWPYSPPRSATRLGTGRYVVTLQDGGAFTLLEGAGVSLMRNQAIRDALACGLHRDGVQLSRVWRSEEEIKEIFKNEPRLDNPNLLLHTDGTASLFPQSISALCDHIKYSDLIERWSVS